MKARTLSISVVFCLGLLIISAINITAQQTQPKPSKSDDVVRVNTNLVQTDVMVFDKDGKFVKGLKREDFELRVDGKPRDLSFFEQVQAGKIDEEAKLAAARGQSRTNKKTEQPQTITLDRGRTVFFFVDDLHLSAESMIRMKKLIARFIDREIGQNDQAGVFTSSGQLGFLQQITDNKDVLNKAVNTLKYYQADVRDFDYPQMTVYQALLIDRNNKDVVDYFVEEMLKQNPGMRRDMAELIVRSRSRNLLQQSGRFVDVTLQTVRNLIKDSAPLPGRKLIFFITDGFILDNSFSDAFSSINQITTQAAKSHTVIYSIDARGLVSGFQDASSSAPVDPTGRLSRGSAGELTSTQDGLYALAKDTGGRAFINTNDAEPLIKKALEETSEYYLLAWSSDDELIRGEKFRKVEVKIIGRPDLTVKSRKGYLSNEKPEQEKTVSKNEKNSKSGKDPATKELVDAIKSFVPLETLPITVTAFYDNNPQYGLVLSASIELQSDALTFEVVNSVLTTKVDVIAVVVDVKGKTVQSIQDKWTITADKSIDELAYKGIVNSFVAKVSPGLYQIRIALRELKSGKVGNASTWIEVPDLKSGKLVVGSLFVAERRTDEKQKTVDDKKDSVEQNTFANISRRFTNTSYLRFFTNIYNAMLSKTPVSTPDVALQVQIFRDDVPVTTTELLKLQTKGVQDYSQIPYGAEVSLHGMPVGRYVLQLTAIDRIAKTSAVQRINFTIE